MPIPVWFVTALRRLGRLVCAVRGHHYHYPGGCVNSWTAYSCVRCAGLSRSLLSLTPRPDDDYDDQDADDDDRAFRDYQREKRWLSFLPFPRWL